MSGLIDAAQAGELLGVPKSWVLAEARADGPSEPDGWLDARGAAAHLGISRHALHRLSSERRIPCSQERPGGRLYFRRSELDRWRSERSR